MKAVIIGGTGHIGAFLSRMFIDESWETVIVSSGNTPVDDPVINNKAKFVKCGYNDLVPSGILKSTLSQYKPDVLIDILQGDSHRLYDLCLETGVKQYIMCGSLWMFGRPKVIPTPEITQTPCPFEGYQSRYNTMQAVIKYAEGKDCSTCAVMPPNICGPGKIPLDGDGGRSLDTHKAHKRGDKVILPYPGTNAVGPCDAEDVAQGFFRAALSPANASGEIFNVGSAYALTSEKFIQLLAQIYGSNIPIEYVQPDIYESKVSPDIGYNFHFLEHMCPDISKISRKVGFVPKYTPEETMERAIKWMFDQGLFA